MLNIIYYLMMPLAASDKFLRERDRETEAVRFVVGAYLSYKSFTKAEKQFVTYNTVINL